MCWLDIMAPYLHTARREAGRPLPSQEGLSGTVIVGLFLAPFPTYMNGSARSANCCSSACFSVDYVQNITIIFFSSEYLLLLLLLLASEKCQKYVNLLCDLLVLHRTAAWFIPHISLIWRSTMRWDTTFWTPDMKHLDWKTYRQCPFSYF